jgi:hypothetical protein
MSETATGRSRFLYFVLSANVIALLFTLSAASITTEAPSYSFSASHFFATVLYLPNFVFAGIGFFVAIWCFVRRKHLELAAAIFVTSLPTLGYGLRASRYPYLKGYHENDRLVSEAHDEASLIDRYLLEYYYRFPERFHYVGEDDHVEVSGFLDFLKSKRPLFARGMMYGERDEIRFTKDSVLSPIGEPLIFLLDRRHDGYLRFGKIKRSVNNRADPWVKGNGLGWGYNTAVGVIVQTGPHMTDDQGKNQPYEIIPMNDTDYEASSPAAFF